MRGLLPGAGPALRPRRRSPTRAGSPRRTCTPRQRAAAKAPTPGSRPSAGLRAAREGKPLLGREDPAPLYRIPDILARYPEARVICHAPRPPRHRRILPRLEEPRRLRPREGQRPPRGAGARGGANPQPPTTSSSRSALARGGQRHPRGPRPLRREPGLGTALRGFRRGPAAARGTRSMAWLGLDLDLEASSRCRCTTAPSRASAAEAGVSQGAGRPLARAS